MIRRLACVVTAVVVCLAAGDALAQSGKGAYLGRWSVSGNLGYAVPNTDEYSERSTWHLGFGYGKGPNFEFGLEFGQFSTVVSQPETNGVPTHDIASGRLDVIPVCLTLQYRVPLRETMATFVLLGGAGYYLVDYTMADAARGVFAAGGGAGLPDQTVSDAWGYHAGAGLEYAISSWFSVTVEGRYVFLAPPVKGTALEDHTIGGSLDLNTWLFTGGIKVAF